MSRRPKRLPDLPLKVRLLVAARNFAVDTSRRSFNYTVNRGLMKFLEPKAPASPWPIGGVSSFDTTIDPSQNLWFRLYIPTSAGSGQYEDKMPVVIYFHGGGFGCMMANSKSYDQFCRRLARDLPSVVISVNYRLAPEHRFPSQFEDAFDTLKFIDGMNFSNFSANVDLRRCFLAGDGAGGNLAHHMVIKSSEYNFCNMNFIGLITIQPFFGGEERTEAEIALDGVPVISVDRTDKYWKAFLPEGSDRDHPVANVFGPNSIDISDVNFPVTLVLIGGFDPLQDWQRRYYEGLRKHGKEVYLVEYPNAIHGFYVFPELAETSMLINDVREFIQEHLDLDEDDVSFVGG